MPKAGAVSGTVLRPSDIRRTASILIHAGIPAAALHGSLSAEPAVVAYQGVHETGASPGEADPVSWTVAV